jgi:mono/diheme cytochrome c family protein
MIRFAFGSLLVVAAVGSASAQTPIERGNYLVNGVLTCGNCHTPRGPGGAFAMDKQLSGGPREWDTPTYKVRGANITPDRETGIGSWTEAQVKKALVDGVRPDGTQLAPIMPYGYYKVFTAGDLDAVVAYLRSVAPISNKVQAPVYKAALHIDVPPGGEKQMTAADLSDPVKRGFYQVTIGHCMECHTPRVNGKSDLANALGKGGEEFKGPWGVSVSRNITSHREKGIGAWSDAEIKRAIIQGVRKDGSPLKPPMGYPLYARMSDADLSDVVAYLRTVPAKE